MLCVCVYVSMSVCMCVCERETERKRESCVCKCVYTFVHKHMHVSGGVNINLHRTRNCICMKNESESHSVVSDSLQLHGLYIYSLWNSHGQNIGVGSRSLLQGIFPTQGSNSGLLHCRWILYRLRHQGSPFVSPTTNLGFVQKVISGRDFHDLRQTLWRWIGKLSYWIHSGGLPLQHFQEASSPHR